MVSIFAIPPKDIAGGMLLDLHGARVEPTTIDYNGAETIAFNITNKTVSVAALVHAGYVIERIEAE